MKKSDKGLPANPLTRADWLKWNDHDLNWGERTLRMFGSAGSTFIVHKPDGAIDILGAPFTDPGQKAAVLKFVQVFLIAQEAVGISFISEFWLRKVDRRIGESQSDFDQRAKSGPSPSKAEDRMEVLGAMLLYRDGETSECQSMIALREIMREGAGHVAGTRNITNAMPTEAYYDGSITALLAPAPPPPDVVAKAKAFLDDTGSRIMNALGIVLR